MDTSFEMGTWNYRVVRRNGLLAIYSAHYDMSGIVRGLSIEPVSPEYDTEEELKTNLELMREACEKSVLDYDKEN